MADPPPDDANDVLAARIPLPPGLAVHCAVFAPLHSDDPVHAIELARRSVLARNQSSPLFQSILPSVDLGPSPRIYLFRIAADDDPNLDPLPALALDGLSLARYDSFPCTLLPGPVLAHLFHAVVARLIDDIVSRNPLSTTRVVQRLKNGFIIAHLSSSSDWEYKSVLRPVLFCHLHVHFSYTSNGSPSHLVVHPIIVTTPFLHITSSLPLSPGTPILLLPYATPAYYLASYSGPTAGLITQFTAAFQGLGAANWHSTSPAFIIGCIKVENKQGEDKGITFIYPTALCLSYLPHSTIRSPLDYIPELPTPLQPSPQVLPALPIHHPSALLSPTSESLHAFRSLTVTKLKDLTQVAIEVGGYVDAVAREREKERERLKRERENTATSSSPRMVRTTATTPASAPTPAAVEPTASTSTTTSTTIPSSLPVQASQLSPNFYPSPPQTMPNPDSSTDGKTSPVIAGHAPLAVPTDTNPPITTLTTSIPSTSTNPLPTPSTSTTTSFDDPYTIDTSWAQPNLNENDAYLGMDMDMDFGMSMNFDMNIGNGMGNTALNSSSNRTGMNFEEFTEDDFSFFDRRPAAETTTTSSFGHSRGGSGSSLHAVQSVLSPANPGHVHSSVHGRPTSGHGHPHQNMWTPGGLNVDGFTPFSVEHTDSTLPELVPSSPGGGHGSPDSHSGPGTPIIHLECDLSAIPSKTRRASGHASGFEPIPFAAYHREADGKYAVGKFAAFKLFSLPSPPPDEDLVLTEAKFVGSSSSSSHSHLSSASKVQVRLRPTVPFRYNALTDPRVGIVRKLIGVKRKNYPAGNITREPPKSNPWLDWEENDDKDKKQDGEKSESDEEEEGEEETDYVDSPMLSRPSTPPPSYLPLGPTLLQTHFQHSHLLPLSTPLRPPGASVAPINLSSANPPPSVPTPVSPAATMGAATERSKSLETAAFAMAAEVVENPVWAQTWRANVVGAKFASKLWSTDVKVVQKLLEGVDDLETNVSLESLFGLDSSKPLQPLEAPMITIGKGEAIIQILPTALRFWEKLGLDPKGGKKDFSAFVLFEDEGIGRHAYVENWIAGLRSTYQSKHYGTMNLGKSSLCATDGFLPMRFDTSFRKSLTSFIASLTPPQPMLVIFLVVPVTAMTLSSPVLRQILSVSKKVLTNYAMGQIFFQFIPNQHVFCAMEKSPSYDSPLDQLASSVYNRILVPVDRFKLRNIIREGFEEDKGAVRKYFMAPSFTLARSLHHKVSFVRAVHTSLDVTDRYMLLHVAYHLTSCGKWIIACCVDQRGEAYDLGVWLTQGPGEREGGDDVSDEEYAVRKVWNFAMEFAKKADIEWRIVFARLGVLPDKEFNAWLTLFDVSVTLSRVRPPLHQSIVCIVADASWSFIAPNPSIFSPISRTSPSGRSPSLSKQQTVFTDISSLTYAIFPTTRIPISVQWSDNGFSQSFIPDPTTTTSSSPDAQVTNSTDTHVPSSSTTLTHSHTNNPIFPHPVTAIPQASSILIYVPHASSNNSISMTHIHLLQTAHSHSYTHSIQLSSSSQVPDDKQLLQDLTKNYHELAVLSKIRWKLDGVGGHQDLPFHLAAVDAMRMALDRDCDRAEGGSEP